MSINTVTSETTGINSILDQTTPQTENKKDPLGRDAFLTMLVAQLKNQDPLNPMQGSDFSAQLAQFSSLEQLFNVNDNLESIKSTFDTGSTDNLLDYIGKKVLSEGDTLTLKEGESLGANYCLDASAATVINIMDENGLPVAQIAPGVQAAGIHKVEWNGKGADGSIYPDGAFTYDVLQLNQNGAYTAVSTGISGKITGVTFDQGTAYLLMGDNLVAPSSVVKVWEESA
ncbi:MAG: flagellar hook assembly protein FlgD [Pseudomonadota bacterium]